MNRSINVMMASTVMASTVALVSCAVPVAMTEAPAPVNQVETVKSAKLETVQLELMGLM